MSPCPSPALPSSSGRRCAALLVSFLAVLACAGRHRQPGAAQRAGILAGPELPPALPAPLPGDPLQVTVHRLANGMSVYLSTSRKKARVSAWVVVRAGSRHDPAGSTGLAHYLEHMLFKGSSRLGALDPARERPHIERTAVLYRALRSTTAPERRAALLAEIDGETQKAAQYAVPNEIDRLYAELGVQEVNAFTADDATVYTADVPSNRLRAWATVEAERYRDPVFRLFYPELEAVYEELNRILDAPEQRMALALVGALLPGHPYGRSSIGLPEHLKNPAFDDMVAYFRRWYVPNNMAIVLAGDVDTAVLPLLEQTFGALEPRPLPPVPEERPAPLRGRKQVDVPAEGENAVLLGWRTVPATHDDRPAVEVMSWLLANDGAGLLDVELELAQKVPAAWGQEEFLREAGYLAVQATAREGQSHAEVEALLRGVIDKLRHGAFSEEDVAAVVLNTRIREQYELESNEARVHRLSESFYMHEPWPRTLRRSEQLAAVRRADVMRVARKYLGPDFVAVWRRRASYEPPRMAKPRITPVPVDPRRESAFARELRAMPATPVTPVWLEPGRDYHRATLPAGPLVAVPNRENQLFQLRYHFGFGYRQQPLLCLALDLLEKSGTATLTPEALRKRRWGLGASFSIECELDDVTIEVTGIDRNLEATIALLRDWLGQPAFTEEGRRLLVANQLSQRRDWLEDPDTVKEALLEYAQFGAQSAYLQMPGNSALERSTAAALRGLVTALPSYQHRTDYFGLRPAAAVAPLLALGTAHRAAPPVPPRVYQHPGAPTIYYVPKVMTQAIVLAVMPRPPLDPAQLPLSQLLGRYVGGGMDGLVFQELREARGLAYSASAWHSAGRRPADESALVGFVGTQADKTGEALPALLGLLRGMKVDPHRFAKARQALLETLRTERTEPRAVADMVRSWEELGFPADPRPGWLDAIGALDREALQRFAAQFAGGDLVIGVVGDREHIDLPALGKLARLVDRTPAQLFGF